MKKFILILLMFVPLFQQNSLQTIPPEQPKYIAAIIALEIVLSPVICDSVDKCFGHQRRVSWHTSKSPEVWVGSVMAGAVFGYLLYRILYSYTPKEIYKTGLETEKEFQEYLGSKGKNNIESIALLYALYRKTKWVYEYVEYAPKDLPGNNIFKENCQLLAEKLKNQLRLIEKHAVMNAQISFFKEGSILIEKKHFNAFKWACDLGGIMVSRIL
jgi:hypothetical protein